MPCGRRHFKVRQRPDVPECWRHLGVSGWPEVCTKACNQVWAKNYSRTKPHYLVKMTSWMIYNHMMLSQKEPDKRKMIQNDSDINAQDKLLSGSVCVTSEHFNFLLPTFESGFRFSRNGGPPVIWIISLYLWYQVYFEVIIMEFLVTVLSIIYLKIIVWGSTVPLSLNLIPKT